MRAERAREAAYLETHAARDPGQTQVGLLHSPLQEATRRSLPPVSSKLEQPAQALTHGHVGEYPEPRRHKHPAPPHEPHIPGR